jgi:c-di-GMP-binding flagellar brake protein YcgR
MPSIKEKRKVARLNIPVEITYQTGVKTKEQPSKSKSFTQDISLCGARILVKEPLALKTPIELEIHLSENSPELAVHGEVVWQYYSKIAGQDFYETGIEFTQIDFQDREKIKEAMFDAVKEILKNLDRLYVERK